MALLNKGKGPLNVHITATVPQDEQECRFMMADISTRWRTDNTHEVIHAG